MPKTIQLNAPPCPRCGSKRAAPYAGGTFRCLTCDAWFDSQPDEGGYGVDPVRAAIAKETHEEKQRQRNRQRRSK